jgi:hypothetical protein
MRRIKLLPGLSILLVCALHTSGTFAQGSWSVINNITDPVQAMYEHQDDLYIGKLDFGNGGGVKKWNGAALSDLGLGVNGSATAFVTLNNELCVGGGFTLAGGASAADVAKWNGTSWAPMALQLQNFGINALSIYNGELYAGGFSFDPQQSPVPLVMMKWKDTGWVNVGGGVQGGDIFALAVFNNELYAAGSFTQAGGSVQAPMIAKWNGTSWLKVGNSSLNGTTIYALKVFKGMLYAAGSFSSTAGGITSIGIARWDGSVWSDVAGVGTNGLVAFALGADDNNLYLGGAFDEVSGVAANHIAKWDGMSWSAMGNGLGILNDNNEQVYSIAAYKNEIYAGGTFTTVNGTTGNYLAKWSTATGVSETGAKELRIQIYPNPITSNSSIQATLDHKTELIITVYDASGRHVATIFRGISDAGTHQYSLDILQTLSAGIYTATFVTDSEVMTRKIVVNKH